MKRQTFQRAVQSMDGILSQKEKNVLSEANAHGQVREMRRTTDVPLAEALANGVLEPEELCV